MKYTGRITAVILTFLSIIGWTTYSYLVKHSIEFTTFLITFALYGIIYWWLGNVYDSSVFYKQRYRSVVETVREIIFQTDSHGRWTFLNPAWFEITGYPLAESVGKHFTDHMHPQDSMQCFQNFQSLIASHKTTFLGAVRYNTQTNGYRWMELSARLIFSEEKFKGASGTLTDITERKELEASLLAIQEEAVQANRAKSEFMSRMSHELRTPMNAVLGFAQLLELSELTETQRADVKEIMKSGRHLLVLINEVLDLAKVESGKITLSLEAVALNSLIEECISLMLPLIENRNLHVRNNEHSTEEVYVLADKIRLKQVLLNLLSNAIKYNVDGGAVRIFIFHDNGERLKIFITDDGLGIPASEIKHIFQPFYRMTQNILVEGTGIGLTIAKQLIKLMGGSIGVNSKVGLGSAFWVELQMVENPLTALQYDTLTPVVDGLVSAAVETTHTLLYIEDNTANCLLVKRILSVHPHFHLLTAPNAEMGISLAWEHRPDLILLDIHLPDMDGYEVFDRLQNLSETCRIPVIAVSANALPTDIEQTLARGFKDYVVKPIIVDKFMRTLAEALNLPPNDISTSE